MEGRTENFNPGEQLRPWGSKLAPRGEVKNAPPFTFSPFAFTKRDGLSHSKAC
jgi:hypothetical protein